MATGMVLCRWVSRIVTQRRVSHCKDDQELWSKDSGINPGNLGSGLPSWDPGANFTSSEEAVWGQRALVGKSDTLAVFGSHERGSVSVCFLEVKIVGRLRLRAYTDLQDSLHLQNSNYFHTPTTYYWGELLISDHTRFSWVWKIGKAEPAKGRKWVSSSWYLASWKREPGSLGPFQRLGVCANLSLLTVMLLALNAGGTHPGPRWDHTMRANVARMAFVIPDLIIRHTSASTIGNFGEENKVYFPQVLESPWHAGGHTERSRGESARGPGVLLLPGLRAQGFALYWWILHGRMGIKEWKEENKWSNGQLSRPEILKQRKLQRGSA